MNGSVPPCRTVRVIAFRGDRSQASLSALRAALDAERAGTAPGPSEVDSLTFTGHMAVSTDLGQTRFGFHPRFDRMPMWQVVQHLRAGGALPGYVREDTDVFATAQLRGIGVLQVDVVLSETRFLSFQTALDGERQGSQYSYGFPNGDGDCNCVTWLERLGLPLLTGRMGEFARLSGLRSDPVRRFGRCA